VQPLYCSLGLTSDTTKCSNDDSEQVILNNKIDAQFQMTVPKKLIFKNIIVDSIDSVMHCKVGLLKSQGKPTLYLHA